MKTAALLLLGVLICMVQAAPNPDTAPDTDELERDKRQLSASSGTVYTRWGKRTCPEPEAKLQPGAKLLYTGRAGGSPFRTEGGASNYLCMPDKPQYTTYTPRQQGLATIVGVELESRNGPLRDEDQKNMPCAVCYIERETTIMIPAKYTCPTGWHYEYSGYLMAAVSKEGHSDKRTMFECVDQDPDVVEGWRGNTNGAVFYHVKASRNGLACPPYNPQKELTCVVCSK